MGATYRYLAVNDEHQAIVQWFCNRSEAPEVTPTQKGVSLLFTGAGATVHNIEGTADPKRSPMVNVFSPSPARGRLWTAGEIHFLATPLRKQFPHLHRISSELRGWLQQFELVHPRPDVRWDYFLEGSIRNYDSEVFALPKAFLALQRGDTYFVGNTDSPATIDDLCRTLRLRGQPCTIDG